MSTLSRQRRKRVKMALRRLRSGGIVYDSLLPDVDRRLLRDALASERLGVVGQGCFGEDGHHVSTIRLPTSQDDALVAWIRDAFAARNA